MELVPALAEINSTSYRGVGKGPKSAGVQIYRLFLKQPYGLDTLFFPVVFLR